MTPRPRPDDDSTGLAGWLYADLLLGLVVVFLGTVTVLLAGSSTGNGAAFVSDETRATTTVARSSTTTTTTTLPSKKVKTFYKKPLKITFNPDQVQIVRDAVRNFILAESLDGEPEVALVLLFGASSDADPNLGASRATRLWPLLIEALPDVFSDRALLRPLNSKYLSPSQFTAEIFFQYFVDEVDD